MSSKDKRPAADYIFPLNMNRLQGRMMYVPATTDKKREILFIYGHHSTIERWWGAADYLSTFGNVTVPDLPGFGGMESLYRIGEKPDLDTMADYLASFVKLRFKKKKFTVIGASYGFLVVTRMLQRYPDIAKQVDLLVSVAGFSHKDDFVFSKKRYFVYRAVSWILSYRLACMFFRNICLHPIIIKQIYTRTHNAKHKFENIDTETRDKMVDFEVHLWRVNDVRTHWNTTHQMLTVNNCKKQVNLPVFHVAVSGDQYFDSHNVEQHLRVIFSDFESETAEMSAHAPSILADADEAADLFPPQFRKILSKKL